jgi:hypothetical protein
MPSPSFNKTRDDILKHIYFVASGTPIDYIFAPELMPVVRQMFHRRLESMGLKFESPASTLEEEVSMS